MEKLFERVFKRFLKRAERRAIRTAAQLITAHDLYDQYFFACLQEYGSKISTHTVCTGLLTVNYQGVQPNDSQPT